MRALAMVGIALVTACAQPSVSVARSPAVPNAMAASRAQGAEPREETAAVSWADVMRAIEAHVCMRTFEPPGMAPFVEPVFGPRQVCELPAPAAPLEHAVEAAYTSAAPMLNALRHEYEGPLRAALDLPQSERLEASRRALLGERFVATLLRHLEPALAANALRCRDCPRAAPPPERSLAWAEFEPYLAAYIWPDEVVTPRDARGRAIDKPKLGMHVCVGINGISALPEPDPFLVELGFLASFHTEALVERARAVFRERGADPRLERLKTDEARTQWLRAEVGPTVVAEPAIRVAVCATVDRFRGDTGLSIEECEAWREGATSSAP